MADLFDERLRKRRVVAIAAAISAVAIVVATTYIMLDIPRAPYTNKLAQRVEYMNTILLNDEKCRSNLRMGIDAFNRLCALLKEKDLLKDTKNCKVEEMVMRFLHMLGHHVRHRVLETRFYRSRETISRQFGETLSAILKLYKCLVADHADTVYRGGTPLVISSDPRFSPYFKDCVRVLDRTHIVATVPEEEQDKFRGRKSYTSQNVLAACSFDLKFTYVLAGWEGSAHDQKVLDDARRRTHPFIVPSGKYYLVDAGYTHQPGFLSPYRGSRYHLTENRGRNPQNTKELYNIRHSNLRSVIERAFGILKKRWPMLTYRSFYSYKTQVKMVLACFVIHNHIMGVDPNDPFILEVGNEPEASNEDIEDEESIYISTHPTQRTEQARWIRFRDDLAHTMFADYRRRR